MCEHGHTVGQRVLVPGYLAAEGVDTWKVKPIDRCIAPIVRALNDGGVPTVASCCGHGRTHGSIVLADGRDLWVTTFDSANYDTRNPGVLSIHDPLPPRCTCESFGNGVVRGNGGLLPPPEGCPRHGPEPVFDIESESS